MRWLLARLFLLVVWCAAAARGAVARTDGGSACALDTVDLRKWAALMEKPRSEWKPILAEVEACAAGDARYQEAVDTTAINLMTLARFSTRPQGCWDFIAEALLISARAGYASAQHNFAVIHNAARKDPMRKYVEQNYETFMEWTCRAGAQREPRAIFNLAVRSWGGGKLPYIKQGDPRIAYPLMRQALADSAKYGRLKHHRRHLVGPLADVKKHLSAGEIEQMDRELPSFDFSTVCRPTAD
jgi:hypothetical protein